MKGDLSNGIKLCLFRRKMFFLLKNLFSEIFSKKYFSAFGSYGKLVTAGDFLRQPKTACDFQ
jgi:hypothetical protein